jgi:hypothetical protein
MAAVFKGNDYLPLKFASVSSCQDTILKEIKHPMIIQAQLN